MANKCIICGSSDVEHPGDVCESCAIEQDPYAQAIQRDSYGSGNAGHKIYPYVEQSTSDSYTSGSRKTRKILIQGKSLDTKTDPYGNSIINQTGQSDSVQIYPSGQAPSDITGAHPSPVNSSTTMNDNSGSAANNSPLTSGIIKNIMVDTQKRSLLNRLFGALFKGIPYSLDNDITMFQVFPDFTGTSLNAMGNYCDQVIVYGKINSGAVAENNDVEVYGHRDSDNNVVAKKIINKASGTTVTPDRVIPVSVIWTITIVVFVLLFAFVAIYGVMGIIWAVVLILCLTNLPLVFKIFVAIIGFIFSMFKRK